MAQLELRKPDDLAKERKRFTAENLSESIAGFVPERYKDIKQITLNLFAMLTKWSKYGERIQLFRSNEDVLQNKAKAEELEGFFDGCIEPFAIRRRH